MTRITLPLPPATIALRRVFVAVLCALLLATGVALLPGGDAPAPTPEAARPPGTADVAAYARAHGLTGLSPAGLAPRPVRTLTTTEAAVYEAYRDIARYALTNDLRGLSPAGLTP